MSSSLGTREGVNGAGAGFGYDVEEILGGDSFGVALLRLHAGHEPRAEWRQAAVYRIEDDKITEIWLYEEPRSTEPVD